MRPFLKSGVLLLAGLALVLGVRLFLGGPWFVAFLAQT